MVVSLWFKKLPVMTPFPVTNDKAFVISDGGNSFANSFYFQSLADLFFDFSKVYNDPRNLDQ
jgi:hypothetical protein